MARRPNRLFSDGNLAIILPRGSARTTSNIAIVGRDPAIIVDGGGLRDPGAQVLYYYLSRLHISPESVEKVLITHGHIDHVSGLKYISRLLPNSKILAHPRESLGVQNPFHVRGEWMDLFQYNNSPKIHYYLYKFFLSSVLSVYRRFRGDQRNCQSIKSESEQYLAGQEIIRPIFTPGHSPGHTCFLRENGDLFLGDMIPRTPWLDPCPRSLLHYVESARKLITLPSSKVHRAIRSHPNVRDKARFVYPWAEERNRFIQHLALIESTLDRIPQILRKRPLTIPQLSPLVMRGFGQYSKLMARLYVDPFISWMGAYMEELEHRGTVTRTVTRGKVWWEA